MRSEEFTERFLGVRPRFSLEGYSEGFLRGCIGLGGGSSPMDGGGGIGILRVENGAYFV